MITVSYPTFDVLDLGLGLRLGLGCDNFQQKSEFRLLGHKASKRVNPNIFLYNFKSSFFNLCLAIDGVRFHLRL